MEHYVVVIGTSAGGLSALKALLGALPTDFPAAVLIVKHIAASAENLLPAILGRASQLPVVDTHHRQPIEPGHIYIAPPKFHMVIEDGKIALHDGPKVNHSRPAIDPLFYSAALHYKQKTIGVLLSGLLDDGSAGFVAIKKCGGITMVQDPDEAEYPDMPGNALKNIQIDYCLKAKEIAVLLADLVTEKIKSAPVDPSEIHLLELESSMNYKPGSAIDIEKIGTASGFICPECQGALWKINDTRFERYRCRVEHAYSSDGLVSAYEQSTEAALWSALRALEEKEKLAQNIARKAREKQSENASYFIKKAEEAQKHAAAIRSLLSNRNS
ncbi:chemotaxis protein CheB [Legionella sp. MW5194]|uniref:chemotaxis protein CheB n=1 Tax=Legionella sp. MW5194 TaxID=2662448 RepID=UPI00193D2E72|nr:chemotaxis protein CheB [Legionella sp. MW5194]QRN03033.1 chemotaxis protein CheB [Legionella sp. MW5194]